MESVPLLDCAGRHRSQATLSSFHQGRAPRNKGLRYPPDPPTVEEIIAVMRAAGDGSEGIRLRGVIIMLWRAGLRIGEALALTETDLDRQRGAVLIRAGKGGRRREVGMDRWAWDHLDPWLEVRTTLPVDALFCVLRGPTRGRPCARARIHGQLHSAALAKLTGPQQASDNQPGVAAPICGTPTRPAGRSGLRGSPLGSPSTWTRRHPVRAFPSTGDLVCAVDGPRASL